MEYDKKKKKIIFIKILGKKKKKAKYYGACSSFTIIMSHAWKINQSRAQRKILKDKSPLIIRYGQLANS